MKHRTVTIFIVVLAFMAVLPQGYQQLSALKEAAGNRLNAGIWNAFLSLNGKKGGSAPRKLDAKAFDAELAAKTETISETALDECQETEPTSEGGKKASRGSRAKNVQKRFAVAESEVELAQLGELDRMIDFDSISKGRVHFRVPEISILKKEAAPRALVIEQRDAEKFAREYHRVLESIRRGEQRKAQKALPKITALTPERAPFHNVGRPESQWVWESNAKPAQGNGATTTSSKSNSQECESTN